MGTKHTIRVKSVLLIFILLVAIVVVMYVGGQYLSLGSSSATGTATAAPALAERDVQVGGVTVHTLVAATPAEQELGLGGRAGLAPDEGMLFVFPQDGRYAFWMKDMRFSIDIIWISAAGKVVYLVPDLSPSTYPTAYRPTEPARYVLELPAGFAAAHHVRVGDKVSL